MPKAHDHKSKIVARDEEVFSEVVRLITPSRETAAEDAAPEGAPERLRLISLQELLRWYRLNLVASEIRDPRGYRVLFPEPEFVHLIKLVTREGREPRNRQLAIQQIDSGRLQLVADRISLSRASELSWAKLIVADPWRILPNWQPMGKANPGEIYIRNFGTEKEPVMRSLVCGITGQTRRVVTHFPRAHFSK